MLQGDFFTILSSEKLNPETPETGTETFLVRIALDAGHRIYDGHFPGNPVVPGVCQVGIVKEALEQVKQVRGVLTSADNIKFLNMIVPAEHPVLTMDLAVKPAEGDHIRFNAVLSDGPVIFLKFRGTLCIKPS